MGGVTCLGLWLLSALSARIVLPLFGERPLRRRPRGGPTTRTDVPSGVVPGLGVVHAPVVAASGAGRRRPASWYGVARPVSAVGRALGARTDPSTPGARPGLRVAFRRG
jgi:hypothetical protein